MRRHYLHALALMLLLTVATAAAWAAENTLVRTAIGPGAYASLRNGRMLFLECRPPAVGAQEFLQQYVKDGEDWRRYLGLRAAPVAFERLNESTQREVLLAVFPRSVVDEDGWVHVVQLPRGESLETIRALCHWLTGEEDGYRRVALPPEEELRPGRRIRIPLDLLQEHLRAPTPGRTLEPEPKEEPEAAPALTTAATSPEGPSPLSAAREPEEAPRVSEHARNYRDLFDWAEYARELEYGEDAEGPYALYRLKQGEALYTAVVVRFTNMETHETILRGSERVQARSGIRDLHDIKPGTVVRIPLDMLAPQFMPRGTPERQQFEEVLETAAELRQTQVRSQNLDGVVVILDAGHGGRDRGAADVARGLYESEINYDIMCRVKKILEETSQARVHVTIRNTKKGFVTTDATRFTHDTNGHLLTTPLYDNTDANISANLRWYLANSIYRREMARGVDPRKVIFTSFHTDKLYNGRMRGTMVYIPGARLRRTSEGRSGGIYSRFAEYREQPVVHTTAAEHRRDEALSRNFATVLLDTLGKHNIRRHKESDPIRAQIRRNGGEYVPAVLRCNIVPTKVLIEVANLSNPTDCERLADPQWRQRFAEAYVDSLKVFFDGH